MATSGKKPGPKPAPKPDVEKVFKRIQEEQRAKPSDPPPRRG